MDITCICGRDGSKLHCPHCGNATVYGLASRVDKVTRDSGEVAALRVYRCRKCCAVFNDDDWKLRCGAPSPRLGRKNATPQTKLMKDILTPEAISALQDAGSKVIPADKDFGALNEKARLSRLRDMLGNLGSGEGLK